MIVMAYRKHGNVHVVYFAINDTSNTLQIVMHKVAKTFDNTGIISLRLQTAPVNAIIFSTFTSFYLEFIPCATPVLPASRGEEAKTFKGPCVAAFDSNFELLCSGITDKKIPTDLTCLAEVGTEKWIVGAHYQFECDPCMFYAWCGTRDVIAKERHNVVAKLRVTLSGPSFTTATDNSGS